MWEPLTLHKDVSGPTVNFKIGIPKAEAVAVVADNDWEQLQTGFLLNLFLNE
jgi:1,4-alpha-glucan branching enzyme